jgi:hypothetical protein
MASSVFQVDLFQLGGEFQGFTPLEIGGDGFGSILDRSPKISMTSLDLTLVDPFDAPAVGDALTWSHHVDWTGTVVGVEESYWQDGDGDHLYVRVTATNTDTLTDLGDVGFGLSETPDNATTYGFKNFVVTRSLKAAVEEIRAKLTTFQDGVAPGYGVDITVDSYIGTTFTIMDYHVTFPTWDAPQYDLDLGFGAFDDATTGGAGGTPLTPPTFPDYVDTKADARIDRGLEDPGGTHRPDSGAIYDTITALVTGYSSIGFSSSPEPISDIPINSNQIGLAWTDRDTLTVTEISGTVGVGNLTARMAFVTGSGTFEVGNSTTDAIVHVVVLPLGQALVQTGV